MESIRMSYESQEDRLDLLRTVLEVLDQWDLSAREQVLLLGLPQDTRSRGLVRYRSGTPLPNYEAFEERARYILGICRAVHSLFPHSDIAADYWITTEGAMHGSRRPLDLMLVGGVDGMKRVLNFLDGSSY